MRHGGAAAPPTAGVAQQTPFIFPSGELARAAPRRPAAAAVACRAKNRERKTAPETIVWPNKPIKALSWPIPKPFSRLTHGSREYGIDPCVLRRRPAKPTSPPHCLPPSILVAAAALSNRPPPACSGSLPPPAAVLRTCALRTAVLPAGCSHGGGAPRAATPPPPRPAAAARRPAGQRRPERPSPRPRASSSDLGRRPPRRPTPGEA